MQSRSEPSDLERLKLEIESIFDKILACDCFLNDSLKRAAEAAWDEIKDSQKDKKNVGWSTHYSRKFICYTSRNF